MVSLMSLSLYAAETSQPRVKLETTLGDIVLELYPDKAPKSVENFLGYIDNQYYDGTVFHRVIKGFMIQGGGFNQMYLKKPTLPPIPNEANNGLANEVGTIAMARTSDPHSATAQFFINTVKNDFLNFRYASGKGWGYAVFGKVVSGMDTVTKIEATPTGAGPERSGLYQDVPTQAVVLKKAFRLPSKNTKAAPKEKQK